MAMNEDDAENRTVIPTQNDAAAENPITNERHPMQKGGEERATERPTHRVMCYRGPSVDPDSRATPNTSPQLPAKRGAPVATPGQMEVAAEALHP